MKAIAPSAVQTLLYVAVVGPALIVAPSLPESQRFWLPKTVLLGFAAAAALAHAAASRTATAVRTDAVLAAVLAFVVASVTSWMANGRDLAAGLAGLSHYLPAFVLFFVVRSAISRRELVPEDVLTAIVIVAGIVAALALLESVGLRMPWAGRRRPLSTLGNRNFVALYAAFALPLLAIRKPTSRKAAFLAGSAVALLVMIIVVTRCRSAWIGAAVSSLVLTILRRRRPRATHLPLAFGALVGVLFAIVVPLRGLEWRDGSPYRATLGRLAEYQEGSGQVRVEQHRVGLAILGDGVLWGAGPMKWKGAALPKVRTLPPNPERRWQLNTSPSSDALRLTTEVGLAGLAAVVFGLIALVRAALVAEWVDDVGAGLAAALVSLAIFALLDTPLFRAEFLAAAAALCALIPVAARASTVQIPLRAQRIAANTVAVCIVILAVSRIESVTGPRSPLGDANTHAGWQR